jgi:hypothetical protein
VGRTHELVSAVAMPVGSIVNPTIVSNSGSN